MNSIISDLSKFIPDVTALLQIGAPILLGILLLGLAGRFIFGKKSTLNGAVSSAIGILFVYGLTVVLTAFGWQFADRIPPLPLATITGDQLILFSFADADYTAICGQLLNMLILSFLVNLVDRWLPKGKGLLGWVFFRVLTVVIALVFHLISTSLLTTYLPEGLVTYAPPILLCILVLMLLTGALKLLVGIILSTVNPLIAALYTFFFANIIGKQITKAVLTTGILSAIVILLQKIGIGALSIASAVLATYLPFILLLLLLWFFIGYIL